MSIYLKKIKTTKSYITLFKYHLDKCSKYKIKILNYNKLSININLDKVLENDNEITSKTMLLTLYFDDNDNIITLIDIDDLNYYKSPFYNEVILPRRDNEAWQIIKKKYHIKDWIEKYVFFILNAPHSLSKMIY